MEILYKVEMFKKVNENSDGFIEEKLYPVRVVRRGDKRVLSNFDNVQINIGWENVYSMSLAIEHEKIKFKENFEFVENIYFNGYKSYFKWFNERKSLDS